MKPFILDAEHMPHDPTITWQFSYPKHPTAVSILISKKFSSEISHVDVVTADEKLLGAHIADGVLIREPNYMEFGLRLRVTVHVTGQQFKDFWSYVIDRIGDKYNKVGILGIALSEDITEQGHEFCSQLQADGIRAANILKLRKDTNMIDPETLRMVVSSPLDSTEERIEG